MIIIQIFSKTPCAKRKELKNEKCTWSSQECICSICYFTNRLLNVSLKRKTINILHHHKAFDYRTVSKSCWYTTSKCLYMISHFSWECLQIPVSCWQMSQFTINQIKLIIFRSPGILDAAFNDRWPIQTDKVIDMYYCSIPTALALSAVVIRRTMMEMLSVFFFSEAFSKWVAR